MRARCTHVFVVPSGEVLAVMPVFGPGDAAAIELAVEELGRALERRTASVPPRRQGALALPVPAAQARTITA